MEIKRLARILRDRNYVIALTGAGISTEPPSAIPDFRSPGSGIWTRLDPEALSVQALRANPALFYQRFVHLADAMANRQPNAGHLALAELSRLRVIRSVITQNIDGLHQMAGSPRVFEVHGSLRTCRCNVCKKRYPFSLLREALTIADVPCSPCCQALLRPDVVLFGDKMADDFQKAQEECFRADFALVIGTSLSVYPAAAIPQQVGAFAIINKEETPLDREAVMAVKAPVGETLVRLAAEIRLLD